MKYEDLEHWSRRAAEWSDKYYRELRDQPVRSQVSPGEIADKIRPVPPDEPESMDQIFDDFTTLIPPGMTNWQHPRFFAYFNSNAAPASILAEQLANVFSAQCMLWQTSPAATELETCMVDWLRQSLGLSDVFKGVIQDSATSATLSAVLTMRERALEWKGNSRGLSGMPSLRIYSSDQVHSSIDKAVRLAGIGQDNLVKLPTGDDWAMDPRDLVSAINRDQKNGLVPAGVIGCIGGTSVGASDQLETVLEVANKFKLYTHVDAAWAGTAMICEEFRSIWKGIDQADSIVVNPHKWLGANFDCSVQFLKEPADQIRTLSIRPSYLETLESDQVTNYSEWVIPLGRRFRALKLWFLFRCYGLNGLRKKIRDHVDWADWAAKRIAEIPNLEIVTPPMFSLFTFRMTGDTKSRDSRTQELLERINADGRIYLTQTKARDSFVIRMTMGQFETEFEDIAFAVETIREIAAEI